MKPFICLSRPFKDGEKVIYCSPSALSSLLDITPDLEHTSIELVFYYDLEDVLHLSHSDKK